MLTSNVQWRDAMNKWRFWQLRNAITLTTYIIEWARGGAAVQRRAGGCKVIAYLPISPYCRGAFVTPGGGVDTGEARGAGENVV